MTSWWGCKTVQPLWETIWQVLKRLNKHLRLNLAISFLGINATEMKTHPYKDLHTDAQGSVILSG